ncbi:hypothetical protein D3C87_947820 [compost metagenome]|uniref:Uncharacterized protein n=1 Tax=Achromobacter phage vB_AchrS_AchV4 TaxID=2796514 RepID=A0A7T3PGW4_9CAUD|nr:nucleotide kinase [Achromobacter phage vB_AchrS_AchV4]QPZ53268.1 hypothetical protein AchV4_0031 [Achromobacter phage vB_AchrS_AchV4]
MTHQPNLPLIPGMEPSALSTQVGGAHYKTYAIQPVEFVMANDWDFCASAILKYVTRWRQKNGAQDLRKAIHFVSLRDELTRVRRLMPLGAISMTDFVQKNGIHAEDTWALVRLDEWVNTDLPGHRDALLSWLNHLLDLALATEVEKNASQPAPGPTDTQLLDWVIPVISGEDTPDANVRTLQIGRKLMAGLSGRDAIAAAMKA